MARKLRRLLLAGAAALLLTATPVRADVLDDILDAVTEYGDDVVGSAIGTTWAQIMRWIGPYLQYYQKIAELFPDNPDWVTPGDVKWRLGRGYEQAKEMAREALEKGVGVMTHSAGSSLRNDALKAANVSPVSLFAAIQIGNQIEAEAVDATNLQNNQLSQLIKDNADQKLVEAFQSKQAYEYLRYHFRSHNGDTEVFGNGDLSSNIRTYDVGW